MSLNLDRSKWKRARLSDVIRHITDRVDAETSGLERFLAGEHIPSGCLAITDWGIIGRDPIGPMFYKRFKPGHVLYLSRRTYLRKVAVPEFEGITGEKTFVLESTDRDVLLQEFLPFVLSAENFHAYAISNSRGSVNPYLNWGELAAYEFDLPPVDEQERMVHLLWSIERHRLHVESLRQLANDLLAKVRSAMFEQVVDGVKAKEMFDIVIGRQRSPKHETGDHIVPYLRSANVTLNGVDISDIKSMNFELKEQARFALRVGDVLVSEASASAPSVGMPAVWNAELPGVVCFQNTLLRYRAIEGVTLPSFVEQYCHWAFETGQFLAVASGTNIRHIGVGGATSIRLRRPTLDEQNDFLVETSKAEASVRAVESELLALKSLATAFMAEIFGAS